MKNNIIEFMLYIYMNYIKENWEVLTIFGKCYIFLPWLVRSMIIWCLFPLFIPEFLISKSNFYKFINNKLNIE